MPLLANWSYGQSAPEPKRQEIQLQFDRNSASDLEKTRAELRKLEADLKAKMAELQRRKAQLARQAALEAANRANKNKIEIQIQITADGDANAAKVEAIVQKLKKALGNEKVKINVQVNKGKRGGPRSGQIVIPGLEGIIQLDKGKPQQPGAKGLRFSIPGKDGKGGEMIFEIEGLTLGGKPAASKPEIRKGIILQLDGLKLEGKQGAVKPEAGKGIIVEFEGIAIGGKPGAGKPEGGKESVEQKLDRLLKELDALKKELRDQRQGGPRNPGGRGGPGSRAGRGDRSGPAPGR
jgi:hypothetical protein